MNAPESGFTTVVEYVRTIDGDTIEVEIRRRFNVRIRNIDAVELKSPTGLDAKQYVDTTLKEAKEIKVFIPSKNPINLMDINSFNRLVGDIYVDGHSLAELIKLAGFEKVT